MTVGQTALVLWKQTSTPCGRTNGEPHRRQERAVNVAEQRVVGLAALQADQRGEGGGDSSDPVRMKKREVRDGAYFQAVYSSCFCASAGSRRSAPWVPYFQSGFSRVSRSRSRARCHSRQRYSFTSNGLLYYRRDSLIRR